MKKVLGTMLAVGLMAAGANAATLSIVWGSNQPMGVNRLSDTMLEANPTDTVSIDVVVNLLASERLNTVGFTHGAQPLLSHESVTVNPNQDNVGGSPLSVPTDSAGMGTLGSVGEQVGYASANPLAVFLTGPGTFNLGSYAVHVDPSATASQTLDITFGAPATTALLGLDPLNNPNQYAYLAVPGIPNFYLYGTGSADTTVSNPPGQAADPLMLHVIPEPASLSLLALGGLALLRRRS